MYDIRGRQNEGERHIGQSGSTYGCGRIAAYLSINSLSAFNYPRYTVLALVMKAYYDSSGNSKDPNTRFLTLAGYVGTANAWQQFEERWDRVLQRWGCSYLHMSDAYLLRKEFAKTKGWTKDRVNALLRDLFNECLSKTGRGDFKDEFYGASCTVNLEDYAKASADMPSRSLKEPEAICVDHVVTIALRALPENLALPLGKEGRVELFFDKGESFMHKVDRIWRSKPNNRLKGPLQLVSSIAAADMREVIGLQAADFLAWHTNRYYTHGFDEPTGAIAQGMRLFSTPLFEYYCDYEYLKGLKT
jgi:hypothetical protein